jgi:hypothetical protein
VVDLSRILYLERGEVAVFEPKKKRQGKNWKSTGKRNRNDNQSGKHQKRGRTEELVECRSCGKKLGSDCMVGSTSCFRCGKEGTNMLCYSCGEKGQVSKDYPKGARTGKKTGPKKAKARAYALTRE